MTTMNKLKFLVTIMGVSILLLQYAGMLDASQTASGVPSAATDDEAFQREVTRITMELRSLKALIDEWPGFATADTGLPRIQRVESRMDRIIQIRNGTQPDTSGSRRFADFTAIAKPILQSRDPGLYQWITALELADNLKFTKLKLFVIMQGLDMYKVDNGRYPNDDEGLNALINAPDRGSYIDTGALTDPWGNAMSYRLRSDQLDFDLFSFGPDGKPGTDDDISYLK